MTATGAFLRDLPVLSDGEFAQFQRLIYKEAGIALSDSKRSLVTARLSRRVRDLALPTFGAYYRRIVAGDGAELTRMLDAITTNETHFFREAPQFGLLAERCCSEWRADALSGVRSKTLRVWSAACSTGEEPYSIAMVLHDRLAAEGWDVRITASDLSTGVLARARAGEWPVEKLGGVPQPTLRRHFLRGVGPAAGRARITPAIRALVEFQHLNLRHEEYPVQGPFDAIFCRNVLIYFDAASRAHVLSRLLERLAPGGYLFLGHAESLVGTTYPVRSVMPAVYRLTAAGQGRAR